MFDCFKLKLKDDNVYPDLVYAVYYNGNKGFSGYRGVYELEEDAKQYCLNNTDKVWMYLSQNLQKPSVDNPWSWPNYIYPPWYKDTASGISYPYALCFVTSDDAENYAIEHTNKNVTSGYSNQCYYPAGTCNLSKNKSTIFKSIAPYEVIEIPPISKP
jgi:hypothetical protein